MNKSLLYREAPTIELISFSLSPLALRIDEYSRNFGEESMLRRAIHRIARIVFEICPKKNVTINLVLGEDMCVMPPSPRALVGEAIIANSQLLEDGQSVTTSSCVALTLIWGFYYPAKNLHEIISVVKRRSPNFDLSLDDRILLPLVVALYVRATYIPPPDLMKIQSSLLK